MHDLYTIQRQAVKNILVLGKTRVGKSTVINSLATGKKIAKEGSTTTDVCRDVSQYEFTKECTQYRIWEVPGLQDTAESDKDVMSKLLTAFIEKNCSMLDLVIYCTVMNRERFESSEIEAMKSIIDQFGKHVWKKVVFALTYANRVIPQSGETDEAESLWFQNRILEFRKVIQSSLEECGVTDVDTDILLSPAGYHTATRSMNIVKGFFGVEDWIHDFWDTCYTRLNEEPFIMKNDKHFDDTGMSFSN